MVFYLLYKYYKRTCTILPRSMKLDGTEVDVTNALLQNILARKNFNMILIAEI